MEEQLPERNDDPVESGALEDEGDGGLAAPIPQQQDSAEGGALDDEDPE